MGFLDKPISELSLAELQRLIRQEVSLQTPAIPTGVLELSNLDVPLVPPDVASQGQVLTYHAAGDNYIVTSPGSLSDGNKPNLSPSLAASTAVIGGIGLLNVTWSATGVSSGDPVGYDVHISSAAGFTPSAATLYGTTMATSMVIKSQANGSSLIYNTNYYVRLIAFDVDGAAAAGVISAATTISADIGTITAGTLIGTTVETGASGQRVYMDPDGVHLVDSNNVPVVDLPTDSTKPAIFNGQLIGSSAGGVTLQGTANQVAQSGKLVLAGGVSQPLTVAALAKATGANLGAATYFLSYSWYNGTSETPPSPVTSIVIGATGDLTYTLPACPAMSGTPQARIYVNTVTFGAGGGHLQGAINVSTSASTTGTLSSYSNAGAASKTTNTFQTTASGGAVAGGAVIIPAFPTDTALNDYSWRAEGNGRIRIYGPTLNVQYAVYEEFLGSTLPAAGTPGGALGCMTEVTAAGGGAGNGAAIPASTNVNPGLLRLAAGTGTTGSDVVRTGNFVLPGVARIRFTGYFQVEDQGIVAGGAANGQGMQNGTNKYQIQVGLSDLTDSSAVAVAGNHVVAFTFDNDGTSNAGQFGLRCTNGAGTTFTRAVDSSNAGVTLAVNVYHLVDFEINPAASSVAWWLDGVPQAAISTNIPTSVMAMRAGITKVAGASPRSIAVDALSVYGDFVS